MEEKTNVTTKHINLLSGAKCEVKNSMTRSWTYIELLQFFLELFAFTTQISDTFSGIIL